MADRLAQSFREAIDAQLVLAFVGYRLARSSLAAAAR
jgi:hypothetical protein